MDDSLIRIDFVKMTGAGNDFVLIDNIEQNLQLNWSSVAPVVCNRRYGVGADGLLVLEKSVISAFKMNYFNADGSYGGMCGNGGRCSAHYVMEKLGLHQVKFETFDFIYTAESFDKQVNLQMRDPKSIQLNILIHILGENISAHFIDTGSPHVIIFVDRLSSELQQKIKHAGIIEVGRAIRFNQHFAPDGVNVDFIQIIDDSTISMRTYERGVEDETLACGTGAVASAICAFLMGDLATQIFINTRSGEVLKVSFNKHDNKLTDICLQGSARVIFHGYLCYSRSKNLLIQAVTTKFEVKT